MIWSSFVDDGVCDCCDGSDEKGGCSNVCGDEGLKEHQRVNEEIEIVRAGIRAKMQVISEIPLKVSGQ